MLGRSLMVAAFLAVAPATPAQADKVIEAQTVWRFDAMTYTIDQGELLTFRNADAVSPGPHDVTASDRAPDGTPVFRSQTIGNGEESPVEGARQLKTGRYGFFCSVHTFMEATLVVTDKGTPLPPGGGGGGSPAPPENPPTQPPDTRRPLVRSSLSATTLRQALKKGSFTGQVSVDEKSTVRVRLTARLGKRTLTVGSLSTTVEPGARRTVAVPIGKSARAALKKAKRAALTLAVEARDAAGNVGTATAKRTVKR